MVTPRSTTAGTVEGGFTLLELLVALALFSMLSLAVTGGIRFGARAWEAVERRGADALDVQASQDAVRRFLGRALPLVVENAGPGAVRIAFDGLPDRISFVAAVPVEVGGGLRAFALGAVGEGADRRLVILAAPFVPGGDLGSTVPGAEPSTLLRAIASVSIAYFGAPSPTQPPAWHDRWEGMGTLPRLVRVAVVPLDPAVPWPDLVVALKVTGPPILSLRSGG